MKRVPLRRAAGAAGWRDAAFLVAAHELHQLPPDQGREVVFAGRSNAGKSSALNKIVGKQGLARTSKTPGRTQQLVVFGIDPARRLVDLPGYGYAEVPLALRTHWGEVPFTASVTPVALGAALAAWDGKFNLLIFGLVLVGSVAIHAGTNLINDYYDWRKGTDTAESLGPNRPLKEKLVTPRQVLIAGLLCFALGGGIGLYLVAARGGLFILVIGLLSVLAGYFYTAGPAAFAYIGLGEVIVFIFMGLVTVATQGLVIGPVVRKIGEARAVMVGGFLRVLGDAPMAFFPRVFPAIGGLRWPAWA